MPTVLITGGASILGRGIASVLIEEGWRVVLSDFNAAGLELAMEELGNPNTVSPIVLDVTDLAAVRAVASAIVARHGSLQALVTAAGGQQSIVIDDKKRVSGAARRHFLDMSPDEWEYILKANVIGTMNACYAVLPGMIAAGEGNIVSIGSGAGLRGRPGVSIYCTAKAGLLKFVQALAQEVGPKGVRVNSVLPGPTAARWQPAGYTPIKESTLGRPTIAKDVGDAVAFLLSNRSAHITGSCIDTSGGSNLH
jgi:NAD(P)-dependent dehydrogenase (short-subunit alcohol dehydrogenase family)